MHVVFLRAHRVCTVHTVCLALSDHSCQTNDATWFWGSKTGPTEITLADGRDGNACTTCAYLSPTPGFFAPFYYNQCLCPYGQRCSDTNDGCLNEGWSLHTMYICGTFYAWLNPAKACGSVLVWNTYTTCIFLRRLNRSKYEEPNLGWTIDGRSKKGRLKHTQYFCTLHAYLRSAYLCAWIILSSI